MKKFLFIFLFFFIISCSDIEFVYKNEENKINPIYNKTSVETDGIDLVFMYYTYPRYLVMLMKMNLIFDQC